MTTKQYKRPFKYPVRNEYVALGLDPTKIEALYLFDSAGNLYDASGNQRHGDISASSGFGGVGRYGIGMFFDGIDDCSITPSFPTLGNGNTEISVTMWMKMPAQGAVHMASHAELTTPDISWYFRNGGNAFNVFLSDDGTNDTKHYQGNITIEDNIYRQVGFVYDGNSSFGGVSGFLQLINNGEFITQANTTKITNDASTTINASSADVAIGCAIQGGVPAGFAQMTCDLMLIYSGLLDETIINNLYNAGL